MMMSLSIVSICVVLLITTIAKSNQQQFTHQMQFSTDANATFGVNWLIANNGIIMQCVSTAQGWIGR